MSCSKNSEQDICIFSTPNTTISYNIVDTLFLNPSIPMDFNDFSSVKAIGDTVFFSSYAKSKIYGINLKTQSTCFTFNYSDLSISLEDFYVGKNLYLLTDYPYTLLQVSPQTRVAKTIFSSLNDLNGITSPFNGDKLYINENENSFTMRMFTNSETYTTGEIIKKCDLDGNIQLSFGKSPEIFEDYLYPLLDFPSKIDRDSLTLIGFGHRGLIEVYNNLTGKKQDSFCASANVISQPIKGISKAKKIEFQDEANFIIETPFYLGLYYDSYRKLYYRIVKHPQPLKINQYKLNTRYDGPWSIIVLNETFDVLGEVVMPDNTFQYNSIFIGKDGIYVAFNKDIKKNSFAKIRLNI